MTLAAGPWPAYQERASARRWPGAGTAVVWRLELSKLAGLLRARVILGLCLAGPFAVDAGLHLQSATPGDTPFGQWIHSSGFAVPMVILGFAGQWVLPILTATVAGDIFASEDHYGTWKTVLTRSRGRGEMFAGKVLAVMTFAAAAMVLLTVTDLAAGLVAGRQPVIGLGGQLIPASHATTLVALSWASEIPPVLALTAVAVLASVASRNPVAGMGAPVLLALACQVVTLIDLPEWAQMGLPSTPFLSWHGFWADPAFYGPFWQGLLGCGAWFAASLAVSWLMFRRRAIGVS